MTLRRGDVWWVDFESSVGGEIQKVRPAVVVSNNAANQVLNRTTVVPLSSKTSRVYPSHVLIDLNGATSKAMADQVTVASKLRFKSRMGQVAMNDMLKIEEAILLHLGIYR